MKWLRRLVVLLLLGVPAWYFLFMHSPALEGPAFRLDLEEVRSLAASDPGARATEVRYEPVAAFRFREIMIVAGESWAESAMPVYAYQLVFPDRTVIVDTAMPRSQAKPDFMISAYDEGSYARVQAALSKASAIVITHEHADHSGGLASHPEFGKLLPALKLTAEQLGHPEKMKPAQLPPEAYRDYRPLAYDRLHLLAPGVVLIKAPGHTPGSQMVYVQLADGRELLFLGDSAWHRHSVEIERERPLLMTLIIGEDRQAVLAQFRTLNELTKSAPELRQVPGHDGPVIRELTDAGYLTAGFQP